MSTVAARHWPQGETPSDGIFLIISCRRTSPHAARVASACRPSRETACARWSVTREAVCTTQTRSSGHLDIYQFRSVSAFQSAFKELESIIVTALSLFENRQVQQYSSFFSRISLRSVDRKTCVEESLGLCIVLLFEKNRGLTAQDTCLGVLIP